MEDAGPTLYCASCLTTFGSDGPACPNMGCGRARPDQGWGRMYQPDEVVDRNYKVVKTLALGGAGVTYLVRGLDEAGEPQDPLIALKLLFASRDHGAYLQRLSTEAQILQQLDHPNIVQYLGFVHRTGQSPYLLTRFEEGGSLLDHMRRVGTLSIKSAAQIGRQVCWALEKGHSREIIHRDLKPENMLLTEVVGKGEDTHVRVADFGIAKVQGSLGTGLTRSGAFVGTPQYAAPEQFVGEPATAAADVYSLGAVLVFLMTAKPVIKKAHLSAPEDVYLKLQDCLPATVQRNKDSDDDNRRMNAILSQVMQFDKDARCSVAQLDAMLEALLDERDPEMSAGVTDPGASLMSVPPLDVPGPQSIRPIEPMADSQTQTHEDPTPLTVPEPPAEPPASEPAEPPASEPAEPPASAPAVETGGGVRKALVVLIAGLFVTVAVAAGIVGYMLQRTPWMLEDVPVLGGEKPHSIKGVTSEKAKIKRRVLKGKLRKRVRDAWTKCADTKRPRGDVVMELVIEPDGKIRWMKPGRSDAPKSHSCVARHAKGKMLNDWSAARPIKARIKMEFPKP